jgi:hypothetical protein
LTRRSSRRKSCDRQTYVGPASASALRAKRNSASNRYSADVTYAIVGIVPLAESAQLAKKRKPRPVLVMQASKIRFGRRRKLWAPTSSSRAQAPHLGAGWTPTGRPASLRFVRCDRYLTVTADDRVDTTATEGAATITPPCVCQIRTARRAALLHRRPRSALRPVHGVRSRSSLNAWRVLARGDRRPVVVALDQPVGGGERAHADRSDLGVRCGSSGCRAVGRQTGGPCVRRERERSAPPSRNWSAAAMPCMRRAASNQFEASGLARIGRSSGAGRASPGRDDGSKRSGGRRSPGFLHRDRHESGPQLGSPASDWIRVGLPPPAGMVMMVVVEKSAEARSKAI